MYWNETRQIGCLIHFISRLCLNGSRKQASSLVSSLCWAFKPFHSEVLPTSQKLLKTSGFCWPALWNHSILFPFDVVVFQMKIVNDPVTRVKAKLQHTVWSWVWIQRNTVSCCWNCLDSMATLYLNSRKVWLLLMKVLTNEERGMPRFPF